MTHPPPLDVARKAALATEIVVAYARVRWLLRRQDFPRALELIRSAGSGEPRTGAATDDRLARAVRRTLRRLPADSRCLMQSLVLTRLLARRGRGSRLVIGVTPSGGFGAHAWVERDGVALLPARERSFERLTEL
jgi:hypothetical protein